MYVTSLVWGGFAGCAVFGDANFELVGVHMACVCVCVCVSQAGMCIGKWTRWKVDAYSLPSICLLVFSLRAVMLRRGQA